MPRIESAYKNNYIKTNYKMPLPIKLFIFGEMTLILMLIGVSIQLCTLDNIVKENSIMIQRIQEDVDELKVEMEGLYLRMEYIETIFKQYM